MSTLPLNLETDDLKLPAPVIPMQATLDQALRLAHGLSR